MFGFIKYLYKDYKKFKKVERLEQKVKTMKKDLKKLSTEEFKKIYGNPSKIFTELQWELIKAKKKGRIK